MGSLRINLLTNGTHIYESKHSDGDIVEEHHHQIHQLIYALDGEGHIRLDGKVYELSKDKGALIIPLSSHSIISDTRLTVLVLAFDQEVLDKSVQKELLHSFFKNPQNCY